MPGNPDRDLEVDDGLVIPAAELNWRFSRSSGPGGQHVNTTDTRVELSWSVTDSTVLDERRRNLLVERLGSRVADGILTVSASEFRSQLRNREAARDKLAAVVRRGLRERRTRRPTKPTRGSQRRRLDQKRKRGETKQLRRPPRDG